MALIASVAFWFIAFLLIIPSLFRNWESSARKIFSATVTPEMVPLSCTTIPIPFCSASIILAGSQLCFLKVILPQVAFCMPAAIEDMVDFPEPFSPIKPLISPGYTSRSTFSVLLRFQNSWKYFSFQESVHPCLPSVHLKTVYEIIIFFPLKFQIHNLAQFY